MSGKIKYVFPVLLFAALACGSSGVYDEALTSYVRVVRSGLNEWYPLNGNLSSRTGSASGTANATYTEGVNRAGESGKTVCTTAATLDFAGGNVGAVPHTVSFWLKLGALPANNQIVAHRGTASTFWIGFKFENSFTGQFQVLFGNGSNGGTLTYGALAKDIWYHLVFTYGSGTGAFYLGKYGQSLDLVSSQSQSYLHQTATNFRIFPTALDACADDVLHYNRVLSLDELRQNFQSIE